MPPAWDQAWAVREAAPWVLSQRTVSLTVRRKSRGQ